MKVLPSSTKGGGEKGSGSMNTTVSTNMVTRGSVAVPRKETVSTPVTSNKKTKKNKSNVVSVKKAAVKTMMEVSNDIFISAKNARDAIEKEKDEEVTKKLMNSSLRNQRSRRRVRRTSRKGK